MFRDPTTQLGVSLLTGQRAVLDLHASRLTLGEQLLAERAHFGCRIGPETRVATRAEASASARSPAGASTCAEARTSGRTEPRTRTGPEAEATGRPHLGEALGRSVPHVLPTLDTTRLDSRKAVNTRERSRLEPALGEGWRGDEQNCREN
jgi:hypothetical protein